MTLQKIVSKISKAVAAISAAALMLTCLGAYSASAASPSIVPGSAFEYTVYTEKVSSNKIALVFHIVNNPGISGLQFAIQYDSASYTPQMFIDPFGSELVKTSKNILAVSAKEHDVVFCSFTTKLQDEFDNYDFYVYFNKNNNIESTITFKTGVYHYYSRTENIQVSYSDPDSQPCDTSIKFQNGKDYIEYIVGDMNNNGKIDMTDSQNVYTLIDKYSGIYGTKNIPIYAINSSLGYWQKYFPDMLCAEVADANTDAYITENDAYNILLYNSYISAGGIKDIEDIGSKRIVVTTYNG